MPEFKFNEVQETWLQALESEEMQDRQCRKRLVDSDNKMCCLGLFCSLQPDVYRIGGTFKTKNAVMAGTVRDQHLQNRLGLRSSRGDFASPHRLRSKVYCSLADMNDSGEFTFREIAAYVRQHPENVFVNSNKGN